MVRFVKSGRHASRAPHRVTQPDRYVEHCEEKSTPLPVPAEDWRLPRR